MTRPSPSSRPHPPRVAVQVARGGGAGGPGAEGPGSRGRHRTPDTGELPASEVEARGRRQGGAASAGGPSRHASPAGSAAPARRSPAAALARVDAAREAASRPATPSAPRSARVTTAGRIPAPAVSQESYDDAVTDLVAGPSQRWLSAMPDGPGTGRLPGIAGLVLAVVVLVAAVVAAAVPSLATSSLGLAVLLAAALLATACSAFGAGPRREGRTVAVTGIVVGLAAVAATVVPLLAL
jgi:hypothetical protein